MKNLFNIKKGDIISITGAGGKTSLMFFLANTLRLKGSVLITTTTKIFLPSDNNLIFINPEEINNYSPQDNFIHIFVPFIKNNKIYSATDEQINILKSKNFDFILIESDGSSNKPLKGWKDNEPSISCYSTKTIAVVDITCIHKEKNNSTIHRLPLYTQQFFSENKKISLNDLVRYIDSSLFFKNSVGENYLFFNKIETLDIFHDFFNISNLINFNSNIYFGSIFKKEIFLFKNITPIILASGFSKRFNGNKLNTKLKNGFSILEQTLKNLNSIYFKEKLLIGKDYFFKNLSLKYNFTYIDNKLSQKGQSQSIIYGVQNSSQEGFLFIPGDMPFLTYKTLIKIIFTFEETNEIIVPIINNQPSAPVLFPKGYTKELLKLTGDTGGRDIFKTNEHIKCYFYNSKEFLDIDTQEELTRLETLED